MIKSQKIHFENDTFCVISRTWIFTKLHRLFSSCLRIRAEPLVILIRKKKKNILLFLIFQCRAQKIVSYSFFNHYSWKSGSNINDNYLVFEKNHWMNTTEMSRKFFLCEKMHLFQKITAYPKWPVYWVYLVTQSHFSCLFTFLLKKEFLWERLPLLILSRALVDILRLGVLKFFWGY